MKKVIILLLTVLTHSSYGQIIPSYYTIPWSSNTVGVAPGLSAIYSNGVPYRTAIYTNVVQAGMDNTGNTDCQSQLQALWDACPSNGVVFMPAGKYLCLNPVNILGHSGSTLRGAGPGLTVLIDGSSVERQSFLTVGQDNQEGFTNIVSGATKGGSNIVVSDSMIGGFSLFVGCMITVWTPDDTNFVHRLAFNSGNNTWSPSGATNALGQNVMVSALSGNNVTVWPPLAWNFTNAEYNIYSSGMAYSVGIEDLTVTHTNRATGGQGHMDVSMFFQGTCNCWVRNVESEMTPNYHVEFIDSVQGTVRDCYLHESLVSGPSAGVGVLFFQHCCSSLVENNIFYRCSPATEINSGSSANVFDYNYSFETLGVAIASQSTNPILLDFDCNHGPHNIMNLWEGNSACGFVSDSFFGSCSHQTLFRNCFTATHPIANQFLGAIRLGEWTDYCPVVANVLGSPTTVNQQNQTLWASGVGVYDMQTNGYSYFTPTIYAMGYPNLGNTSYTGCSQGGVCSKFNPDTAEFDSNRNGPRDSAADLIEQGGTTLDIANWDYLNNAVINPTNNIPTSLYYASKPVWWDNSPWPPIGSDLSPKAGTIPAQNRFASIMSPFVATQARIHR